MPRKRKGLRAQMRDWNHITREMQKAAKRERDSKPRCGCALNLPEADPSKFPCPCGDHCDECKGADRIDRV